jgi:hypothetical protein
MVRPVGLFAAALGCTGIALVGLGAATDRGNFFEMFLAVTFLGGIWLALLLARAHSKRPSTEISPDPFARDAFSTDTLNFAHVRVAGVGGLGLVLVAALMAFEYQLVAVAVVAGLMGGALLGCALIVAHRHRGLSARSASTSLPGRPPRS